MTKYSYFIFDIVFLLPKKYWKDISLMAKDYSTLKDHTHGIIGPREEFARQGLADFWEWPCHDREFDEKTQEYHPGIGFGYRRGGSFDYSFELTRHRDLVVIKPKNMPQEIMDDCFWIMEPYFLSYYARLKAINISNENQRNHNA
jgi:hypothetical protein